MPHIILNMDNCLNAMAGNATNGGLVDLKTAYHALDNLVSTSTSPPEGSHELLEEIQSFLCDGGTYEQGAAGQVQEYTGECNAFFK